MSKYIKSSLSRLKAREILRSLPINDPREIEVKNIAWIRGALVRDEILEGSEGRLVCGADKGIITVNANIQEPGKKRFVIAHELGHFELHKDSEQFTLCADRDFLYWYEKMQHGEFEANEFAAELLMPEHFFLPECKSGKPCMETISSLADQFGTSLIATALRYVECSPYCCAIVVSQDKRIKWYRASEDFGYYIEVGAKLNHNTIAIDFFNGKELPKSMETVLANSWISGRTVDQSATIKEQSIGLSHYNTVLTFLLIDEDIDDLSSYEFI